MQPAGWVTSGLTTPNGSTSASCSSASSIMSCSRIWRSTTLRRSLAASGLVTGSVAAVERTMPASSAACGTVSWSAVVLKYVRAAAGDPGRAVAEGHDVQVAGEDLLLAQAALQLQRDLGLLQLPRRGLLGRLEPLGLGFGRHVEQVVLDVLLGEGGRALHHVSRRRVGDHRAHRALPVHALVLVEPAVLDRHDRRLHGRRDLPRPQHLPVLGRIEEPGDRVPALVGHRAGLRQRPVDQLGRHAVHAVADGDRRRAQRRRGREHHARRHHPGGQAQRSQQRDRSAHRHSRNWAANSDREPMPSLA